MKVLIANGLVGSILCCLYLSNPAIANSHHQEEIKSEIPQRLSAKELTYDRLATFPVNVNLVDRIITLEANKAIQRGFGDFSHQLLYRGAIDILINQDDWLLGKPNANSDLDLIENRHISLEKKPYTYQEPQGNVTLGYQNTFWPSQDQQKYWGLTTVEHWGGKQNQELTLPQTNYAEQAPSLPAGNSALTVSGGGNQNLVGDEESPGEFEEFRGGVSFHRGVSRNVTMGLGFVYENLLVGFSQFSFQDDRFPLATTVSLLTGKEGFELHSHIAFQPSDNFVVNYYNDETNQKFDLDWGMIPGLNLIANGNSKEELVSTGLKISINSDFFSLAAKAELDSQDRWKWNFNSTLGAFKLIYDSNHLKKNSEVNLNLLEFETFGFQCSLFLKHEIHHPKDKEKDESFVAWGSRLHSGKKIDGSTYLWALELGFGSGIHGNGAIASVSTAFQPNLKFKLTFEEVSAVSDETKLKLELSSQ